MSGALTVEDPGKYGLDGEGLLEAWLEGLGEPAFIWSREGVLLMANAAWAEAMDKDRRAVLGRKAEVIFTPASAEPVLRGNRLVMERGKPSWMVEDVERAMGRQHYVAHRFPIRNGQGEIVAVGGILLSRGAIEEACRG